MDFIDQVKKLAEKVARMKDQIATEEATKNAFVMPFIQCLGYDVFNPNEVVPEFVADIGVKKGEKVDYAILKDSAPIILIECKHWREDLLRHNEQLYRYFSTTKAKFGILTNGIVYMFFTDLEESNKMDSAPFFQFDITAIKDNEVEELKKFHKSYFEIDTITSAANDLKYASLIKSTFVNDLKKPSESFVRYFIAQVYPGRATERITSYFTDLVKVSLAEVVNDLITDRLKSALSQETKKQSEKEVPESVKKVEDSTEQEENKIVTTEEEIESYYIVKGILRDTVPLQRIVYRDAQTYFTIILDDNNRKPICRVYLNSSKKYLGLFDDQKKETKHEIASIDDIFNFSEDLKKTAILYQ